MSATGGRQWDRESGCPLHAFSLVVCRRYPDSNEWLAVEENNERGWWLPGGFVECGDDHTQTARKETLEEAGIQIELKGILRVENDMNRWGCRQRVIYYAEPKDRDENPKSVADRESRGARWMTVNELEMKAELKPPMGLRGTELLDWAKYIEGGGRIYPLLIFSSEEDAVPKP